MRLPSLVESNNTKMYSGFVQDFPNKKKVPNCWVGEKRTRIIPVSKYSILSNSYFISHGVSERPFGRGPTTPAQVTSWIGQDVRISWFRDEEFAPKKGGEKDSEILAEISRKRRISLAKKKWLEV